MEFAETMIPAADGKRISVPVAVLGATGGAFAIQRLDRQNTDCDGPEALYVPLHVISGAVMQEGAFYSTEKLSAAILDFWMSLNDEQRQFLSAASATLEIRDRSIRDKYKQHILNKMDVFFL